MTQEIPKSNKNYLIFIAFFILSVVCHIVNVEMSRNQMISDAPFWTIAGVTGVLGTSYLIFLMIQKRKRENNKEPIKLVVIGVFSVAFSMITLIFGCFMVFFFLIINRTFTVGEIKREECIIQNITTHHPKKSRDYYKVNFSLDAENRHIYIDKTMPSEIKAKTVSIERQKGFFGYWVILKESVNMDILIKQ